MIVGEPESCLNPRRFLAQKLMRLLAATACFSAHALSMYRRTKAYIFYKIAKQRAYLEPRISHQLRACCCFLLKLFQWLPNKFAQRSQNIILYAGCELEWWCIRNKRRLDKLRPFVREFFLRGCVTIGKYDFCPKWQPLTFPNTPPAKN
jgi:hypothetical protein